MHPTTRQRTFNGSATAKLTTEEESRVRERADECGLTKSAWCRQAILRALDVPSEMRILLAEFMALRAVLLMLHTDLLQGCEVTKARIALALQQNDAKKYAMADNRIRAFLSRPGSDKGNAANS